jgi:hypothetical protein
MSMKILFIFLFLHFILSYLAFEKMQKCNPNKPFEKHAITIPDNKKSQNVRIVFYNVENLYDPYDDTLKLDNEFTAEGDKHWTYARFQTKLNHVAKTLIAIGGWEPPAIAGLCEVENRYVLNKLIYQTPLQKFKYRMIHHDSPDLRGIDVALLYRPEIFTVLSSQYFEIRFPFDTTAKTREILMVKGKIFLEDTVIIFINHWPSRRGGYLESEPRRKFAATILRGKIDSVLIADHNPKIIITGDFNDEPDKESLSEVLKSKPVAAKAGPGDLVNLMYSEKIRWDEGTIQFQGKWSVFDQFIVTGNLVRDLDAVTTLKAEAHIFRRDFLTGKDDRNLGEKLNRTYAGPRYLGGFSDHLPVYLDLIKVAK